MARGKAAKLIGLAAVLFVAGCTAFSADLGRQRAYRMTAQAGWSAKLYGGRTFDILTFQSKGSVPGEPLSIVIEGDGRAWLTKNRPSSDPTPLDPIGLRLALKAREGVVYIARPCQFVQGKAKRNCDPVFWTNARFAPEVLDSMNSVIDQVKQDRGATSLRLIGFSGGGTLAALLSLKRSDVSQFITVASPLDIDAWAKLHTMSPLRYSLNPASRLNELAKIPQVHFVGTQDKVVPPYLTKNILKKMPPGNRAKIVEVENADHRCCWADMAPLISIIAPSPVP